MRQTLKLGQLESDEVLLKHCVKTFHLSKLILLISLLDKKDSGQVVLQTVFMVRSKVACQEATRREAELRRRTFSDEPL